jgi:pumilio RNA-binding family
MIGAYKQPYQKYNTMNNYSQRINNNMNTLSFDFGSDDINDILVKAIELCKDHNGSRFIQKKYEEASDEEKDLIFEKIFPFVSKLSVDQFGNYVIQKMFECGSKVQRKKLIGQLEGIVLELTLDTYGCRVVQRAIDVIELEDVRKVLAEIRRDVKRCIEDQNGNHAIQKLVEKLPRGEHHEILKFVYGKVI